VDRWDIAKERVGAGDEETYMWPNYYIMRIPGYENVEFVNSIPYTPKDKNNMISLLVARNDGDEYGKLVMFQLPKGEIVMGPSQIDAQIAQHTLISQDFALWENSGSTYSRGNMFVIPIENSFMYVEPIYLRASIGSLPEVKRVIVYYDGRIAYKETLREALNEMWPGAGDATLLGDAPPEIDAPAKPATPTPTPGPTSPVTPTPPAPGPVTPAPTSPDLSGMSEAELVQMASDAYSSGQDALKRGDWAAYGEAQKTLENCINQLIEKFGQ